MGPLGGSAVPCVRARIGRRRCADATRPSSKPRASCREPVDPAVRRLGLAFASVLVGPYPAQAQSAPDTLAIRAAKQIDVAYSTDSPPFSFAGEGKRPTGYSIDLCQRVIAQIGRAAGVPDLRTNWVSGSVGERLEMVRSGKVQLECGNTSMPSTQSGV